MMKNSIVKNAFLGIALALVAAYLFPSVLFTMIEGPSGFLVLFTVIPLYGLLYSFWLVIPLGAALGMLIPQMAKGKSRWMAALHGAVLGAVGGFVTMFCFFSVFRIGRTTLSLWVLVLSYCALWVGGYAFLRAKGQSIYR